MQKETADALTAIGTIMGAIATTVTIFVAVMVYRGQRLLSQRQLLIPLWEYMAAIRNIDVADPSHGQILIAANTLELVAVSVEGRMVDPAVIHRTFDDVFITIYNQIEGLPTVPGITRDGQPLSGKAFLGRFPASMDYYAALIDQRSAVTRIKPNG